MPRPVRLSAALGGLIAAFAVMAPGAQATITEIGATGAKATGAPSCPADCIAVTRTTGYQAKVGPDRGLYVVPRRGRIVAWTITLGKPGKKQSEFFADNFGGEAQAGIAVLRTGTKLRARTVAVSPLITLTPYFGTTVQFPLAESIKVEKGMVIALNVPTWAPALAVGLPSETSWRASREDNCKEQATTQLQTSQEVDQLTQYRCLYKTARLTYSATLISTVPEPTATTQQPGTR
jgi:hypothetical protein